MFKNQTRGRRIYAALGGSVGIITIIVVAIIVTVLIVWYVRKKTLERIRDQDDFLRYLRLIKPYLRVKRDNLKITEDTVQFQMDRFEFSNTLLPVGDASLNLTWDRDSSVFGDLCNTLMGMVSYGSDPASKYYRNDLLWRQIMFAIRTIAKRLPDSPRSQTTPWGTNWYQFSITYPTFLVSTAFSYYETFGTEDPFLTRHLSLYISNYFKESAVVDGLYSLGWRRYESNVIGMSVPVIGGRLYANRFDPAANSQRYARDYMTANYVYENNGFYYDNTYVTHVSRNDGYTTAFYHEFVFVFEFYRMQTRFFKVLHKNFSILEHPDFPVHHGPWFTRTGGMNGFEPGRKFARYGVDIRGYGRGVCVRSKLIALFYNGQLMPLASYESDRTNREWGQCWIFMRRALTKTSATKLYKELVPYYDGVHSYGCKRIDWPSLTTTTTVFPPEDALCSLAYLQDKVAAMYNKYRITMAGQFKFEVEELNMATPAGFHVFYRCRVDMVTASAEPYTIAVHLGKLDAKQSPENLAGVGGKHAYAFDNFMSTHLYLEETDQLNLRNVVRVESVVDPETTDKLDALYVQPTPRQVFTFGFSNNYFEYGTERRLNNLREWPTLNALSTGDYRVEKMDTEDALLFLHDYPAKMCAVTYAFNYRLPKGIKIKKSVLDDKFAAYDVVDGIFDSNENTYTVNTYEKQFQMLLKNVTLK